MSARRVLFRCDGGRAQGLGHLTRCVSLARHVLLEAPNTEIAFWGNYDSFAKKLLARYGFSALSSLAPPCDVGGIDVTRAVCADFDVIFLDSYALDQSYIDALKQRSCRLALVDDDHRHDLSSADLVICFRAGAESVNYNARHQLLGPSFVLVKPELRALREYRLDGHRTQGVRCILVFLSGGDLGSAALPAVLKLLNFPGVDVVYLASNALEIPALSAKHLPFTPEIETIYAKADVVLCGGGLTKYECAYAGIPNACLSLTALQDDDTRRMAAQGFTLNLGLADALDPPRVRKQFIDFIRDPAALAAQQLAFASKLDVDGPRRVAQALVSL